MSYELGVKRLLLLVAMLSQLLVSCHAQTTTAPQEVTLRSGAEEFLGNEYALGGHPRLAVVANQTSMVGNTHFVDTLLALGADIRKIFCPEHGFRGTAAAGAHVDNSVDAKTGLPIISLYGKNKKPTPEQLKDVDCVVFDLQDVGCRFYTYISTLHYVMEACAEAGIPLVVLDRPNPNGHYVDGPVLDTAKYRSFVGMHPVPVVHGMTIGEYGMMLNGEGWLANGTQCALNVVKMQGYDHNVRYTLPVAPSPNLQNAAAVYLYPSLCLFEGTVISVGRGTDRPFEIYGHPALTAGAYKFTPHPIPGVSENPPLNGQECRGFELTDYALAMWGSFNKFSLEYILTAYKNFPKKDQFFLKNNFFDKLAGTTELRKQIAAGMSEEEIRATWQHDLDHFREIRSLYLLYPDFQ